MQASTRFDRRLLLVTRRRCWSQGADVSINDFSAAFLDTKDTRNWVHKIFCQFFPEYRAPHS